MHIGVGLVSFDGSIKVTDASSNKYKLDIDNSVASIYAQLEAEIPGTSILSKANTIHTTSKS